MDSVFSAFILCYHEQRRKFLKISRLKMKDGERERGREGEITKRTVLLMCFSEWLILTENKNIFPVSFWLLNFLFSRISLSGIALGRLC